MDVQPAAVPQSRIVEPSMRVNALFQIALGLSMNPGPDRSATDLRFTLVTSRAVGKPHEWLPLLAPWMADGGRVALFQGPAEAPSIPGFRAGRSFPLMRGHLVTFHVEQA